jgi:8-oxo-dGTP diphosphatase
MTEHPRPRLRVALIALDDEGRVLLLQHERVHGKYWVLPGGGVDAGESIEDALVREIAEELSVGCSVDELVAVGELIKPGRHVVDFFMSGTVADTTNFKIRYEEGISDARWFDTSQLDTINVLPPEIVPVIDNLSKRKAGHVAYLGAYRLID